MSDFDDLLAMAARFDTDKVDPHSRYVIRKLADAVRQLQDALSTVTGEGLSAEEFRAVYQHLVDEQS